ncbi:hypothetical protein Athai_39880 [Actinocatenispora thailandica]|uniref:Tyr recombinase domain-containing protein n=1 Tax=Actinocatenispora thailandica TaxID=227318 RepID=A0A7R7DRW0_9ACTN|nr:hypothetical protein Athai_39880 [Actinocatenispora thailandica]
MKERAEDGYEPDDPLFPNNRGTGFRDPSNVLNAFRAARGTGDLSWVTSHTFRKTMATFLDDAGFTPRMMADQLGHERPSMTQDVYLARNTVNPRIAAALEDGYATQIEK